MRRIANNDIEYLVSLAFHPKVTSDAFNRVQSAQHLEVPSFVWALRIHLRHDIVATIDVHNNFAVTAA